MLHQYFLIITLVVIMGCQKLHALEEPCSRTALIQGENIAIDSSTTQKGEGLRYYLSKDKKALEYLDKYRDAQRPNWKRIGVSTFGVGLLLAGVFSSNDTSNSLLKRDTLLVSGGVTVLLSYLYAKTRQSEKEIWLKKSINEYNQRLKPKIIFSPQYSPKKRNWGLFMTSEF